jgi:hypothetical protein
MKRFVKAFGNQTFGYPLINVARIARFEEVKDERRRPAHYRAISATGETLGLVDAYEVAEIDEPCAIVSETQGTLLVEFWLSPSGTEDFEVVCRYAVIAWKIEADVAEPIIAQSRHENADAMRWCLEFRSGLWLFPECSEHDSFEEARLVAFKELRRERLARLERAAKQALDERP